MSDEFDPKKMPGLLEHVDIDTAHEPLTLLIAARDRDWPTFWQSLTPLEVAAALRAAPKVAGEWERDGAEFARHRVGGIKTLIAETWNWSAKVHPDDHWIGVNVKDTDEGRALCDEYLRDAGWVLL